MYNSTIYDSLTKINSKVELYEGSTSTLKKTCSCNNELESFKVSREGDTSKFFGFGICKQLTCTLIDLNHDIEVVKGDTIKLYFGSRDQNVWDKPLPTFYVTEVERDEKNDSIQITAFDKLYEASEHTIAEITNLTFPYDLQAVTEAVCSLLGLTARFDAATINHFKTLQFTEADQPNYNGDENLRTILNQIAEATQHVYFIEPDDVVYFKMLLAGAAPDKTISRDEYFELSVKDPITLKAICNVTELGDNVEAVKEGVTDGVTQYIKENPYLNLKESADVAAHLDAAVALIGGNSITPFSCDWDSDYRVQPFDYLELSASDGLEHYSYFICDTLEYTGSISQVTEWEFTQDKDETATNSSKLGEILNQTTAKVDKTNKQITLLVSDIDDLQATTDSELNALKANQTTFTQTATDITLRVENIETNGTTKVQGTGYKFDEEGFTVSKDNASTSTMITEDGMTVSNDSDTTVLTANSEGVTAHNLRSNYMWVGEHSRFEDYEGSRTGCFWIGE